MSKQDTAKPKKISTFPGPPLSESVDENAIHEGDTLIAVTKDSERVKGLLVGFDPVDGLLEASVEGKPRVLKLENIKIMHLPRMREWAHNTQMTNKKGVFMPLEPQSFKIVFKDGDELKGETLGFHADKNGFYLFPTQKRSRYICVFMAHRFLSCQHIGPPIGEMLVKNNLVTTRQLDHALDAQQEERQLPLGDYLKNKAIVTRSELEEALARQKKLPNVKLGSILVTQGMISDDQLQIALQEQVSQRGMPLGRVLIRLGMATEHDIQLALARKLGIPYVDLVRFQLDLKAFDVLSEDLARKARAVVLQDNGSKIIVAVSNPLDWAVLEMLGFATGKIVEAVMASEEDILDTIDLAYSSRGLDELKLDEILAEPEVGPGHESQLVGASDHVVARLVNKLITDAAQLGASDIHIEPQIGEQPSRVRIRRDGILRNHTEFPNHLHRAVASRVKVMANMDSTFSKRPQDGKIDFSRFSKFSLEVRVVTLPTIHGTEDVVLRLMQRGGPMPLRAMNLNKDVYAGLNQLITATHGLILVCGPTGSGKTTTLHSVLAELNTQAKKILTIEDPVEITQSGLSQMPISEQRKMGYGEAMRSILRADPDIIMIGEMRDKETAHTAIEAALTGHLVLSTLHTNSASETVVRMLEMGMDPFNFSDALLGVLSQRLVQTLCPDCRESHVASDQDLQEMAGMYVADFETGEQEKKPPTDELVAAWRVEYGRDDGSILLNRPRGCPECEDSGYVGRIAVHELLVSNSEIRAMVVGHRPASELNRCAMSYGMHTLRQDGIEKVLAGVTDLAHVRVLSNN